MFDLVGIENINPNCDKCHGKGYYAYDENHAKICELCCPHDRGWQELKGSTYNMNRHKEMCMRGCGTLRDTEKNQAMISAMSDKLKDSVDILTDTYIFQLGYWITVCRWCKKDIVVDHDESDPVCNNLECVRQRHEKAAHPKEMNLGEKW